MMGDSLNVARASWLGCCCYMARSPFNGVALLAWLADLQWGSPLVMARSLAMGGSSWVARLRLIGVALALGLALAGRGSRVPWLAQGRGFALASWTRSMSAGLLLL
jgi:hypothetical protein